MRLVFHDLGEAVVAPFLEGEVEALLGIGRRGLRAVSLVEEEEAFLDRVVGDHRGAEKDGRLDDEKFSSRSSLSYEERGEGYEENRHADNTGDSEGGESELDEDVCEGGSE